MNETIEEPSTLLRRASSLRDQGDARGALDLLQGSAARWPESAQLHVLMGLCHADLDQVAEAEQEYRRSLELDRQPDTLSLLSHALLRQGRDAESLVCLREVLELDPDYEEAHYNIGCHLRLTGDVDAAIDCFQRALDIDPDYALAHAELGFALLLREHGRGNYRTSADARRALCHLRRSVELNPEYHWSRLYLGNLLWILKRAREARVHYEAAARLVPDNGFVLSVCADFLSVQSGGSGRVDPRFRRAVELDPEDASVRYYYGRHLLRAKRYGAARRELLLADRLGHPRAREALAGLDEDADE